MAPFRIGRSTRSGRPGFGQTDQDIVEGLPIRQWRKQDASFGAPPEENTNNEIPPEGIGRWLLLPMPNGSESYTPWCQQLLRAARAGRIPIAAKRSIGIDKDDDDDDELDAPTDGRERKTAKKEDQRGFTVKKWTALPRNLEEPEREYLARRRKGLPSAMASALTNAAALGPMRRTKVQRVDTEGNVTIWDVLIPEGQTIEGEIESDVTIENVGAPVEAPTAGTVVEGIGVANNEGVIVASASTITPLRRRGPPPRRKGKKGSGKRHKLPKMTESAGMGVSASAEAHAAQALRKMLANNGDVDDSSNSAANNTPAGANTGEEDEQDEDGGHEGGDEMEEDGDDGLEDGEIEEEDEDEDEEDEEDLIINKNEAATTAGSGDSKEESNMPKVVEASVKTNLQKSSHAPDLPLLEPKAAMRSEIDRGESSSPESPLAASRSRVVAASPSPLASETTAVQENASIMEVDVDEKPMQALESTPNPISIVRNTTDTGHKLSTEPGLESELESKPKPEPAPDTKVDVKSEPIHEGWLETQPQPEVRDIRGDVAVAAVPVLKEGSLTPAPQPHSLSEEGALSIPEENKPIVDDNQVFAPTVANMKVDDE